MNKGCLSISYLLQTPKLSANIHLRQRLLHPPHIMPFLPQPVQLIDNCGSYCSLSCHQEAGGRCPDQIVLMVTSFVLSNKCKPFRCILSQHSMTDSTCMSWKYSYSADQSGQISAGDLHQLWHSNQTGLQHNSQVRSPLIESAIFK